MRSRYSGVMPGLALSVGLVDSADLALCGAPDDPAAVSAARVAGLKDNPNVIAKSDPTNRMLPSARMFRSYLPPSAARTRACLVKNYISVPRNDNPETL